MAIVEANLELDAVTGLRILPSEVYFGLSPLRDNMIWRKSFSVQVEDYPVIIYDATYRDKNESNELKLILGQDLAEYRCWEFATVAPIHMARDSVVLRSWAQLIDCDALKMHLEIPPNRQTFGMILSVFACYKPFNALYDGYVENPDNNIQLVDVHPSVANNTAAAWAKSGRPTVEDYKATCHLLLLLMSKRFPENANITIQEHMNRFMLNRKKAVGNLLDKPDIQLLISPSGLNDINALWGQLSELRIQMFELMYRVRSKFPEIGASIMLLTESSMVTIKCMTKFMEASEKCNAHAHPEIWKEMVTFTRDLKRKKEELRNMWPFYRILQPKDSELSVSKYPNLARAAILYYKTFIDNSPTFARVAVPSGSTIANLDMMSKTPLDPTLLSGNAASELNQLSDDARDMGINLGINLETWYNPARPRIVPQDNRQIRDNSTKNGKRDAGTPKRIEHLTTKLL